MKFHFQVAFASLLVILMSLVPASAFASRTAGGAHTHSQTYHDRTPTVHVHSPHHHR